MNDDDDGNLFNSRTCELIQTPGLDGRMLNRGEDKIWSMVGSPAGVVRDLVA